MKFRTFGLGDRFLERKKQTCGQQRRLIAEALRIPDFWIWRQKPKALRISRPLYLEIDTKREERDKGVSGAVEFGACGGNLARNINKRTQMSKPMPEETESGLLPPVAALRVARATKAAMDAGVAPVRSGRKMGASVGAQKAG
jgi:hypothetical protein